MFQKDLGEATAEAAPKISTFDPDTRWQRVDAIDLEPLPP